MRRALVDALIVLGLVLAVALLYRKVTRLWWIWDDAYLLHIAAAHPVLDHFVDRSLWLSMPQQLFTPLLTASYDAELALFGPNPRSFYLVHLIELAVTAVALYFTLLFWMSRAAAACAALLFLIGTPVGVMATQLVLKHYIESVILSMGSVALFTIAMRRGRELPGILSGFLYLAAMLAKEIAVPLPVVLLILPEGNLRARLRALWPHAIALLIYFPWRYSVLGKILGGYAWTFGPREIPLLIVRTLARVGRTFTGPLLLIGAAFLILVGCGILLRLRSRFDALAVALAFAVALAPIFPVATQYENRFAYVSWLCAAIVFASGTETLRNRRLAAAMMISAPLLGVVVNRQAWKGEFNHAMRMSDEGRVFMDLGAGDFLRAPAIPPGTMFEVEWIKENLLHRAAGSRWFFDDLYLCSGERPRRVFGFDERSRTVREMTVDIPTIASRYCASILPNEPLAVHFHYQKANGFLRWDLGPYDQGAYGVVVDNGFLSYDVKRRDVLQMTGMKLLSFRVRYRSPRGWATYSPELTLHFDRDQDLTWRR